MEDVMKVEGDSSSSISRAWPINKISGSQTRADGFILSTCTEVIIYEKHLGIIHWAWRGWVSESRLIELYLRPDVEVGGARDQGKEIRVMEFTCTISVKSCNYVIYNWWPHCRCLAGRRIRTKRKPELFLQTEYIYIYIYKWGIITFPMFWIF